MVESDKPQELELIIPQVQEFYFDPENKVFIIGSDHVEHSLEETKDIFYLEKDIFDLKQKSDPDKYTLGLSPLASLIEFPQLRDWISNLSPEERTIVSEKVTDVIEKVYRNLSPTVKLPKNIRGGFMGFSANLKPDGSFGLSTFGNCACLGKNPNSYIIQYAEFWPDLSNTALPLEYDLHNDDTPAQRLSLYAGAGALAWLKDHEIYNETNP